MLRVPELEEIGGIENLPSPPVVGRERLTGGCQCQDKWPFEESVAERGEYLGVNEGGPLCQRSLQARRRAVKVYCLGAYPIASEHL
jgi:hypothetical protein